MPVPSSFNDLDPVAGNNSPPGSESPKGVVDNYLRAAFGFIRQLYDSLQLKAAKGANSDITSLTGLTTAITVAQGGTGATTAVAARTALGVTTVGDAVFTAASAAAARSAIGAGTGSSNFSLPSQTGNSGKALVTDGFAESWGYPTRLSTTNGSAPAYAARAFVNFNGTGGVAIRASGNVTSITDNGVGDYTVNFLTQMPISDFITIVTADNSTGVPVAHIETSHGPTPFSVRVKIASTSPAPIDASKVNVVVYC